ncbi:glycoside hydrolase [Rhodocyclus tenuis]|uniref:Glycoside hydrolase n=2 Tax=Rhodocyclus TaxID=1064 RepID=A0A6L5JT03_RHOTE|nr:glycoside hydrolase family 57 protein [Rhodocyclus gracilis]MQY50547.1 glycoside hydrolase [Rhodocyclus gracilis]MRD72541.1 glycoside hydrolase [Rhodocyclus gracilis]NJA88051.1 glycoside hydrolase [Rhodocyclus gracilis]
MTQLAFLWHMHQPDYRRPGTGEFTEPWVLLHGIKDYTDMAGHLERHPQMHCTVNFVPVLLDQLEDYSEQFASGHWRDRLLAIATCADPESLSAEQRRWIRGIAFRCHAPTMLEPFAPYRRLRDLHQRVAELGEGCERYLAGIYYTDLAIWYLLAWTGETVRREQPVIAELMARGSHFSLAERQQLIDVLGATLTALIGRWRALAARGQIELSCSPQAHPLSPLLIDFASAREAWAECVLPAAPAYPGGTSRVAAQLDEGIASHQRRFGAPPAGLWPAEGALSAAFLEQIAEHSLTWTASSAALLHNSLGEEGDIYRPWRVGNSPLSLFFRDEHLSDLIGFEYARWHGRDAALHFVGEVERIAGEHPDGVVSVILDGENAWETYPYNGWHFFEALYSALAAHPQIATVTLSTASAAQAERHGAIATLVAGSWVYGSFSTWIGDPAKNRAWELLCDAKHSADLVLGSGRLSEAEAAAVCARLTVCESSDWFWWFGDYNPAEAVASFDILFRDNLRDLYRLLKLPAPAALDQAVSHGHGAPETGGAMRRAS